MDHALHAFDVASDWVLDGHRGYFAVGVMGLMLLAVCCVRCRELQERVAEDQHRYRQDREYEMANNPLIGSGHGGGLAYESEGAVDSPSSAGGASYWTTVWDEGSRSHYYYNARTGQTQWEPPEAVEVRVMPERVEFYRKAVRRLRSSFKRNSRSQRRWDA